MNGSVALVAQILNRSRIVFTGSLAALAVLWLMANPVVSGALLRPLEMRTVPSGTVPPADAIVVLGGCTEAAFPPQPTVHLTKGADRIVYAAQLYREQRAPLVVLSGGGPPGLPESAQMAEIIQMLGVPKAAILEEPFSRNTHENAVYVRSILLAHHVRRILLVTSAAAMPRALAVFRRQGTDAVPMPTDFMSTDSAHQCPMRDLTMAVRQLLPDSNALDESTGAMKEYLGLAVYWLVGWI